MNPDPHSDYRRQAQQHFGIPAASPGLRASTRLGLAAGNSAYEHQNIALLPDEDSLFAGDFTASPLLRHIKTGLVVTADRLIVRQPQYMLFVIKVGHAETSVPIAKICEITTGRLLSPRRVLSALISGGLALMLLMSALPSLAMSPVMGVLLLLVSLVLLGFAAFQLWLARGLALTVSHAGGNAVRVDVDKLEHDDMIHAANLIQQLALGYQRTNTASAPAPSLGSPEPSPAAPRRPAAPPQPSPADSSVGMAAATTPVPAAPPAPAPAPRTPTPPGLSRPTPPASARPTIWRG